MKTEERFYFIEAPALSTSSLLPAPRRPDSPWRPGSSGAPPAPCEPCAPKGGILWLVHEHPHQTHGLCHLPEPSRLLTMRVHLAQPRPRVEDADQLAKAIPVPGRSVRGAAVHWKHCLQGMQLFADALHAQQRVPGSRQGPAVGAGSTRPSWRRSRSLLSAAGQSSKAEE